MKFPKGKKLLRITSAGVLASSSLLSLAFASSTYATPSSGEVRFDNMKVSATTTGTVCAKPISAATEGLVAVTFPTGFSLATAANWTVNTTNVAWPATATAWLGISTTPIPTISGQTITFTSGDLTVGTLYCFNWAGTTPPLTEPSSQASSEAGTIQTQLAGGTVVDTIPYATATLTDNTVTVTATVPPIFNFAVSANSDPLGTLSSTALTETTSGHRYNLTVGTNAKNGFQVWANDTNTGLSSTQASYTIASHTGTITLGQEFYNTGVFSKSQVSGSGTVSIGAGFDDTGDNKTGVGLTPTLQTVATSTGTADTSVLTVVNNVGIKTTTPAATDYTDVQNYVAAALF